MDPKNQKSTRPTPFSSDTEDKIMIGKVLSTLELSDDQVEILSKVLLKSTALYEEQLFKASFLQHKHRHHHRLPTPHQPQIKCRPPSKF
jgi:hypothetical protein